jgi:ABC-2 type transporter
MVSALQEALTHPENFFLDEPSSGLDSESALQVMEFLKAYVTKGSRVVLTIHQPSSFIWQTIDHVILLSKGQLMYNGARTDMERFFAETGYPTPAGWNPADHYVTTVNDEFRNHALSVPEWASKFAAWSKTQATNQRSAQQEQHAVVRTARSGSVLVAIELTYRNFLNLAFNPGKPTLHNAPYCTIGSLARDGLTHDRLLDSLCFDRDIGYTHCHVQYAGTHGGRPVLGSWQPQRLSIRAIQNRSFILLRRLFYLHVGRCFAIYRHGTRHCR